MARTTEQFVLRHQPPVRRREGARGRSARAAVELGPGGLSAPAARCSYACSSRSTTSSISRERASAKLRSVAMTRSRTSPGRGATRRCHRRRVRGAGATGQRSRRRLRSPSHSRSGRSVRDFALVGVAPRPNRSGDFAVDDDGSCARQPDPPTARNRAGAAARGAHYGTLLEGAHAGIATRLAALEAELEQGAEAEAGDV
jgi:hypothetical protein